MENRMVLVKNMENAVVGISKPEFGFKRKWQKKGQVISIPYDLLEQLLWDPGIKNLIDTGILYIESMKDKIDLGIEPEGATEPENVIVLNEKQMENLWVNTPISVFKREVSNLMKTQVDILTSYAIEHNYAPVDKCAFIKELSGKDILKAISLKQDEILEAKAAQAKADREKNEEGRR